MAQANNERGFVLGIIMITAVIFGIAAFGLLYMALNSAQQATFVSEDRMRARYAAEAGLVMAMQEQWASSADCGLGPYPMDTDADTVIDTTVVVTMTPCPAGATPSKLQAKVTYTP